MLFSDIEYRSDTNFIGTRINGSGTIGSMATGKKAASVKKQIELIHTQQQQRIKIFLSRLLLHSPQYL